MSLASTSQNVRPRTVSGMAQAVLTRTGYFAMLKDHKHVTGYAYVVHIGVELNERLTMKQVLGEDGSKPIR